MGGSMLLGKDYEPLKTSVEAQLASYNRVILKPSIDSCSGHGVMLFKRQGDRWCDTENDCITLTEKFLYGYGNDFILQEALSQHPDIAKFNPSSINTLRLAVYRSVVNEEAHVVAAVMRIGKNGAFIDNAHAGGRFVGIDIHTGKLMKSVCDQYGNVQNSWNGYDFSITENKVPSWEKAVDLCKQIALRISHMRLIAFDIAIDADGNPRLVEFNVDAFGFWVFMYTNQTVFGPYTDEVINYCKMHKKVPIKISVHY